MEEGTEAEKRGMTGPATVGWEQWNQSLAWTVTPSKAQAFVTPGPAKR